MSGGVITTDIRRTWQPRLAAGEKDEHLRGPSHMARTYIVDRFEINPDDILGTGGFGQVLRSLDKSNGELVAAKVIDTKRMRREKILQEIQLLERVGGHSGVVGLRGAQEVAELHQIFIFMELAQVRSQRSWGEEGGVRMVGRRRESWGEKGGVRMVGRRRELTLTRRPNSSPPT